MPVMSSGSDACPHGTPVHDVAGCNNDDCLDHLRPANYERWDGIGFVCAECGVPVESEPCEAHPAAIRVRKKPVVVDAIRWTGANRKHVHRFIMARQPHKPLFKENGKVIVPTREGLIHASQGDWIVRGVEGEVYPVKPSIFAKTYDLELVDNA